MNISIVAVGRDRFEVRNETGTLFCVSHQPALDSARVLLAAGVRPETALLMVSPDGLVRLKTTVGQAAQWTVEENDTRSPRFRRWKPNEHGRQKGQERARTESPVRLSEEEAPHT
jgi:hypothetical protein